jgi:hypothetical protein
VGKEKKGKRGEIEGREMRREEKRSDKERKEGRKRGEEMK